MDPEEEGYNNLPKSQINGKRKTAAAQPPREQTPHLRIRDKQNRESVFSIDHNLQPHVQTMAPAQNIPTTT